MFGLDLNYSCITNGICDQSNLEVCINLLSNCNVAWLGFNGRTCQRVAYFYKGCIFMLSTILTNLLQTPLLYLCNRGVCSWIFKKKKQKHCIKKQRIICIYFFSAGRSWRELPGRIILKRRLVGFLPKHQSGRL